MALGGYLVLSVIWVLVCCFFKVAGVVGLMWNAFLLVQEKKETGSRAVGGWS